ncbi:protein kinase [Streptomyces sp. NPDC091201]|uniref:serine/threonine-protein kinase n=1 Tax=Streptomyces sp. NPDC091201 TaxID=3155190 RepID=UPI00342F5EDA
MQGEKLAGRYRLEKRLGRGAAGQVWRAEDLLLHRPVAVKLVQPLPGMTEVESSVRFLREARAVAGLRHPHIVTAYDRGQEVVDRRLFDYLVMEYLEGRTLDDVFRGPRRVRWQELTEWSRRIAEVLAVAHRSGFVHRDVKPQNVMLTDTGVIKVLDFGIVKLFGSTTMEPRFGLTGLNRIGTPQYMSPEQCSGAPDIDHRTDLYSLGCLMYEGLAAVPLVTASTAEGMIHQHISGVVRPLEEIAPVDVPLRVTDLVMRMLAKDPAERPPDADTVVRELRAATRTERRRREAAVQRVRTARAARAQARARDRAAAEVREAERMRDLAGQLHEEAERAHRAARWAREESAEWLRQADALREEARAEAVRVSTDLEWSLRERRATAERELTASRARAEHGLAQAQQQEEEHREESRRMAVVAARRARRTLDIAQERAVHIVRDAQRQAERIQEESAREQAGIAAERADLAERLQDLRGRLLAPAPAPRQPGPAEHRRAEPPDAPSTSTQPHAYFASRPRAGARGQAEPPVPAQAPAEPRPGGRAGRRRARTGTDVPAAPGAAAPPADAGADRSAAASVMATDEVLERLRAKLAKAALGPETP